MGWTQNPPSCTRRRRVERSDFSSSKAAEDCIRILPCNGRPVAARVAPLFLDCAPAILLALLLSVSDVRRFPRPSHIAELSNHIPRTTTWTACAFSTSLLAGAIPNIADCSSLVELSNIADQLFYLIIGDLVFESRHLAALAIFYDPSQLRIRQLLHLRGAQIWHAAHGPTDLGIAASICSMARGTF